jgi:DNA-binding PadR family transcriptional regulator
VHEATFLILTALVDQPRHGYGVLQEVEALSGGRVRLRASTLYDALDRLAAAGLIEVSGEETVGRRLRRFYRLTRDGRTTLATEAERLRHNADVAVARLRAGPSGRRVRPDGAARLARSWAAGAR